jgi:hypothetical protein
MKRAIIQYMRNKPLAMHSNSKCSRDFRRLNARRD